MSKYLKKGMHLVYLDQCVLSRFLDTPKNQQWLELRDLILKGNATRKSLCPTSLEHLIETAALPDDDEAIFLDDLIRKLSFGWTFADEPLLVAWQIITKLRERSVSRSQFLAKHLLRPITYPGTLVKLRAVKCELDQNNAWVVQGVNEFNALVRDGQKASGDMLQILIKLETGVYVKKLLAEVLHSLETGRVVLRTEDKNDRIMNWASKVVYELITKHRLTLEEGQKLCHLLKTERLKFIPTLKTKAELQAMQFFRREKIEPRDQYDITRAACVLPYADIFITDGGKASAIRELKLDTAYKTEVFSMKKSELPALTARLKEIVG
ncbi:MAG: hypothetical protein WCS94_18540 [Verrucomicrobiota bacterium]